MSTNDHQSPSHPDNVARAVAAFAAPESGIHRLGQLRAAQLIKKIESVQRELVAVNETLQTFVPGSWAYVSVAAALGELHEAVRSIQDIE